ncbi:MAG: glycosyltransferase family 2 protein [Moheibacter sp.]
MSVKITVITPTYNRAHTLGRAYESLVNQSFKEFKWIIMDDESTDGTQILVKKLQAESPFGIEYFYNPNQHKFHTVFEGIKKVDSPYFMILDSDDSYPQDAFESLYQEIEKIPNPDEFISVMGLSGDENGEVVGDAYPNGGFDGSILEMRYKFKVRGDKNGMFITKSYQRELKKFDYSGIPSGIYIPQSVFFNRYDAQGVKTRFTNKIVRFYHQDDSDKASVSNTRWSGKNQYGLMLGYLSFLNAYGSQLFLYPNALFRNIVGYQIYAFKQNIKFSKIIQAVKHPVIQLLGIIIFPFSYFYSLLKN